LNIIIFGALLEKLGRSWD